MDAIEVISASPRSLVLSVGGKSVTITITPEDFEKIMELFN